MFSGWSLSDVEGLSGSQMMFWVTQANRIAEKQRKESVARGRNR
ncbi:hypothetical protein APS_2065 [Acetobacter pasteurianus subsp. pasteurianus LMG 1262 = NBRC 106471]|nr:hypothetical protein [Acetobacter pasteurianus]GAB31463.1 hypothetical protein APS_2065 [Acetobacter pasteurianus subsp. pasteurianus LMG 1262 = NBRC 106471]